MITIYNSFRGGDLSHMLNMSAPKLEVLRFYTAEDVIVTSGTADTSFTFRAKTPYFTNKNELQDAGITSNGNYKFFWFTPEHDSNDFVYSEKKQSNNIANIDENAFYAWYNNSAWHTENKTSSLYKIDGSYIWTD